MSSELQTPEITTINRPNAARMYDYFLGGFHNTAIDRQAAEELMTIYSSAALSARANRAFLRRAVTFCLAQGIEQFLDIGSGIPTIGNVHEIAQHANSAARVVYVDSDPIAVIHSRMILKDNPNAIAIRADASQPDKILNHPDVTSLLDFQRPMAVLLVALLSSISDDDTAFHTVNTLREALAPNSYVVITHGTFDDMSADVVLQYEQLYARTTSPMRFRSRTTILRFFEGVCLVEPGLVYVPLWRPETPDDIALNRPDRTMVMAAVGRK